METQSVTLLLPVVVLQFTASTFNVVVPTRNAEPVYVVGQASLKLPDSLMVGISIVCPTNGLNQSQTLLYGVPWYVPSHPPFILLPWPMSTPVWVCVPMSIFVQNFGSVAALLRYLQTSRSLGLTCPKTDHPADRTDVDDSPISYRGPGASGPAAGSQAAAPATESVRQPVPMTIGNLRQAVDLTGPPVTATASAARSIVDATPMNAFRYTGTAPPPRLPFARAA